MSRVSLPFAEVFSDETGGNPKTLQSDVRRLGSYPVVDQGKDLIAGYVDDAKRLARVTLPVIIFGDHTRIIKYVDFPFCIGADGTKVIKPVESHDAKYLYHFLRHVRLTNGGYDRHFKYLKRISIPLPPLPEQRRIAAILDHADALRAKRRAALAKLDSLTQSIFLDMFGDPVTNPKRWPSCPLPEICKVHSGGTPSKAEPTFWEGDIPWFSAKDMKRDDLYDSQDHVSTHVFESSSLRLFAANTVAIVVRGMILAHTFPVCVLRRQSAINQDLKALIPLKPLSSHFLATNLRSQSAFVLTKVSEAAHGTKRLDSEGLRAIQILFPPPIFSFALKAVRTRWQHSSRLPGANQSDWTFSSPPSNTKLLTVAYEPIRPPSPRRIPSLSRRKFFC